MPLWLFVIRVLQWGSPSSMTSWGGFTPPCRRRSLHPPAARLVLSGDLLLYLGVCASFSWGRGFSRPRPASGHWDQPKKQSGKVCRDLWWWEGCRVLQGIWAMIPGELSAQLGGKYGNKAKGTELGKVMPLSSPRSWIWGCPGAGPKAVCVMGVVGPAVRSTPSGDVGKGLAYLCWAGREISQRISCGLRGWNTWLLGMGG